MRWSMRLFPCLCLVACINVTFPLSTAHINKLYHNKDIRHINDSAANCYGFWAYLHTSILSIFTFKHFEHICIWAYLYLSILSIFVFEHFEHICIWAFWTYLHLSILSIFTFEHFEHICIWAFWAYLLLSILSIFAFEHFEHSCIWALWVYLHLSILSLFAFEHFEHIWSLVIGIKMREEVKVKIHMYGSGLGLIFFLLLQITSLPSMQGLVARKSDTHCKYSVDHYLSWYRNTWLNNLIFHRIQCKIKPHKYIQAAWSAQIQLSVSLGTHHSCLAIAV